NQVEKMLKSGNSDEQIADYMVTRYGDFILYNPPLKTSTLVLWAGPLLMVIIGIIIVANIFRRRDRQKSTISPQDLSRAKSLINDKTPH
ncbi:MAG TPA: cytochrome C biogenesis protein CcmH, partial [Gammaproteobacteria bacterium]|nr:cytochrome C biogenesis protein CcmH [Gammaproteobacteria bacterium]